MTATAMRLHQLNPGAIGWTFGRRGPLERIPFLGRLGPVPRCLLVAVIGLFGVLIAADLAGVLVRSGDGAQSPWVYFHGNHVAVKHVQLSLLQDPVGLVVLLVTLATPMFCAVQVSSIEHIVGMNEDNLGAPAAFPFEIDTINGYVAVANRRFALLGRRPATFGIALTSLASTAFLYWQLFHNGVLASWNPTSLADERWKHVVFAGWWANVDKHPLPAIALCLLGWYMLYFLSKQLLMGGVFALFAHSALRADFGVTPNLEYDSDGYAGLRQLRRFMLWTYGSSLAHFVVTLGVLVVWLPMTAWTLFICLAIMLMNATVVVYPSMVAHRAAVEGKKTFVESVHRSNLDPQDKQQVIDRVWATPNLPFRTRSTFTAVTVYLLFPLFLAIVSALING
jgi:hypothetical protein